MRKIGSPCGNCGCNPPPCEPLPTLCVYVARCAGHNGINPVYAAAEGADVTVTGPAPETDTLSGVTGADGRVCFAGVLPGVYHVTGSLAPWEDGSADVAIDCDDLTAAIGLELPEGTICGCCDSAPMPDTLQLSTQYGPLELSVDGGGPASSYPELVSGLVGLPVWWAVAEVYESTGLISVKCDPYAPVSPGYHPGSGTTVPIRYSASCFHGTWRVEKAFYYDRETFRDCVTLDFSNRGWNLCPRDLAALSGGRYRVGYCSDTPSGDPCAVSVSAVLTRTGLPAVVNSEETVTLSE